MARHVDHVLFPDGRGANAGRAPSDHARLSVELRTRQRWSGVLAEFTAELLTDFDCDPLALLADRVVGVADADLVAVLRPIGRELIMVEMAKGRLAEEVSGLVFRTSGTLTGSVMANGQPLIVPQSSGVPERPLSLGPTMLIPFAAAGEAEGVVSVARTLGRPAFTELDVELTSDFLRQATVALGGVAAAEDRQQSVILAERSRVAADLHDQVIQRLFGAGLRLEAIAGQLADQAMRAKVLEQAALLEDAIAAIRVAIFNLEPEPKSAKPTTLREQVVDVVRELSDVFGASPQLEFTGILDSSIPARIADDLLAVLREGLTNVVRHAHANQTLVSITVSDEEVLLKIVDNGIGLGRSRRVGGIANMEQRAERWGGSVSCRTGPAGGTVLDWTARLRSVDNSGVTT